jgi:hypothetical protein
VAQVKLPGKSMIKIRLPNNLSTARSALQSLQIGALISGILLIYSTVPIWAQSDGLSNKELDAKPSKVSNNFFQDIMESFVDPVYNKIYQQVYEAEMQRILGSVGIDFEQLSDENKKSIHAYENMKINIGSQTFACENDKDLKTRAYILVGGVGSKAFQTLKLINSKRFEGNRAFQDIVRLLFESPSTQGVMTFQYDDRASLYEISRRLLRQMDGFLHQVKIQELVLLGLSAGGNLLANLGEKIPFEGRTEIHTLASPLRGYGLSRFGEQMLEHFAPLHDYGIHGFYREIGNGMQPYPQAKKQTRVYHHKEGSSANNLISHCGEFRGYCDPLKIQHNNVQGSQEFYSPSDLDSLRVVREILSCRKP